MAQLTGTLVADFSSFQDAVRTSEIALKSFESESSKVSSSLNRMADSFSGKKVIADAEMMAKVFADMGGKAAFTEKELARMGATGSEAVAKLRAIGAEVPAEMQRMVDATQRATGAVFDWKSMLVSTAGALGVAFSVNALKNFVGGLIETGAAIGDLSEKLGVSTDAVQGWSYAAEQSGTTIETVDAAVKKMNANLGEGSKSTIAALAEVGLKFEDIRNMAPEDAFETIADAIAEVEDPMIRAKVATELFGRAGQELLPMFLAGVKAVSAETAKMSEETIRRLKAADDAYARWTANLKIYSSEALASIMAWPDIGIKALIPDKVLEGLGLLTKAQEAAAAEAQRLGNDTEHAGRNIRLLAPAIDLTEPKVGTLGQAIGTMGRQTEKLNTSLITVPTTVSLIEPRLGSLDKFVRQNAESTEIWNSGLRFTSEVVGELPPKLETMAAAVTKVAAAQAQAAAVVSKNAPGSVGVNLGEMSFGAGGLDAAMAAYTARYSASSVGAIGGGPAKDFLSWASSMGYATKGAAPIQNTFNIVDTESNIAKRVAEEINRQVRSGSLVNV